MLKLLKKIPWHKLNFKRELRNADELFSNGKIFEARNKELDYILKQLTSDKSPESLRDKNIIRAITVLSIKSNKYKYLVEFFLIILTIFSLYLAWMQTNYARQQTLPITIEQNTLIRKAMERCKENPNLEQSGLNFESGKSATCAEVLNSSQAKKFIKE